MPEEIKQKRLLKWKLKKLKNKNKKNCKNLAGVI